MRTRPFSRLHVLCLALTFLAAIPAAAGKTPAPSPVPYVPSGTLGVSVRFIPSAPPAGGARQIYVKPGTTEAAPRTPASVPSQDPKYTQSFAGPKGTTILFVDPAQAVYETARVTPKGSVQRDCGRLSGGRLPGARSARSSVRPPAAQASEEQGG